MLEVQGVGGCVWGGVGGDTSQLELGLCCISLGCRDTHTHTHTAHRQRSEGRSRGGNLVKGRTTNREASVKKEAEQEEARKTS